MRLLLVGDPHVTVDELADSQALLDYVLVLSNEHKPDCVVFLGDQHHNHAVVRVEVTDFWLRNLAKFSVPVVLLVGNHDRPNDASSTAHALQPYKNLPNVEVISDFTTRENVVFAPYVHDRHEFERIANSHAQKGRVLICHQTFDGSKYENGMFAPDGADAAKCGFERVISGHIHTAQEFEGVDFKVTYIGSPRWRTASDENVAKQVAIYDTETSRFDMFRTDGICSPIGRTVVHSTDDLQFAKVPFRNSSNARQYLDIVANSADIPAIEQKARTLFPSAKIRPLPTDTKKTAEVTESEGINKALGRYVKSTKPPNGTPIQVLEAMITKRIYAH